MNISIWSDIRCPFCYIGKRNFEKALANFPHKDDVIVEWKSFELDPAMETRTDMSGLAHFMQAKNVDKPTAEAMFANVTNMAKTVDLDFQFNKMIPANSLKAHQLLHFAKKHDLADAAKEALLKAHLIEGENIDDIGVLMQLASKIGLEPADVKTMIDSEDFIYEVRQDQMEARNLGINAVPFFVLDHTYGISGAQPVAVFTDTLEKAWKKHQEQITIVPDTTGNACAIDGNCD
tara:strand:- start:34922 stop:35623 length:702 start_codon:yes stop_codon:yes gene_type:complete